MATPVGDAVPLSGNAFIDGLVQGSEWQFSGGNHVLTYSLSLNDTEASGAWTGPFTNAIQRAFTAWSNVADITFVESGSGTVFPESGADIAVTLTGSELQEGFGAAGLGVFPDPEFADELLTQTEYDRSVYPNPEGDVFFDNDYSAYNFLHEGGLGYAFMLHEIGHALGLKHTSDDGGNGRPTFAGLGIAGYDETAYTLMGLLDQGNQSAGNPATPMLLDILAIQHIYGANMSFRTGNDTYVLSGNRAIWDAGGVDTIDASTTGDASVIDLRAGQLSRGDGTVVGIAYNVTIENAIGSIENDGIFGNDAANILDARGGDDSLRGGAGNDTLDGGDGHDLLAGEAGNDSMTGGSGVDQMTGDSGRDHLNGAAGNDTLEGGSGNDTLVGGSGADVLTGGSGNDSLDGGASADDLTGGLGDDIYAVTSSDDVFENAGEGFDIVRATSSYVLSENVEFLVLLGTGNTRGVGNAGDNEIDGNSGNNKLTGNVGNDVLDGGTGADTLLGGGGNDVLIWDAADLEIRAGSGRGDILRLEGAGQALDLTTINNSLIEDVEVIDITGTGNNDLTLALADVLAISGNTDQLRIDGNVGDDLTVSGGGWTQVSNQVIGANTYERYTQGAGMLLVDTDITTTFA